MDRTEKQVIDELFGKLELAERQGGPRDGEAEALIQQRLGRQPAAPYYMAQAIVFQEEALRQAQQRLQELESELAQRPAGGGFLAGLFGGEAERRPQAVPRQTSHFNAYRDRGGFLGGAMQTAMGVAGGMMLGSFLHSMITGGNEAAAADPVATDAPPAEDPSADSGFDSGWDGGFDDGGGFDF
ncbi:MAG TPA: DUF2076 domain-containing protein [Kiloniellales bacterium]|nr:DUF2076 domain-containing protein [Kiloniellales bacterium]